jgi:hypothetical protein
MQPRVKNIPWTQRVINIILRTQLNMIWKETEWISNTTCSTLSKWHEENYLVSVYINSEMKLNFCWQLVNFLSLDFCTSDSRSWDSLQWSEACRLPTKQISKTQIEVISNLEDRKKAEHVKSFAWRNRFFVQNLRYLYHTGTICRETEIQHSCTSYSTVVRPTTQLYVLQHSCTAYSTSC